MSIAHEGKRIHRTVHAPDDHRGQRLAEREVDLLLRQHGPGYSHGDVTVPELLDAYLVRRTGFWGANPIRGKTSSARAIATALPMVHVRSLTHAQIRGATKGWRTAGIAESTIYERVCVLKSALLDAVRGGMLDVSPAQHFPNKKGRPRIPAILDIAVVHQAIRTMPHQRTRMFALLALATGARLGELVALQWPDVNFETGEVTVAYKVSAAEPGVRGPTKTGKVHTVAIDPWTTAELLRWRTSPERQAMLGVGRRSKWVFANGLDSTRPWSPGMVSATWLAQRSEVGLESITIHDLRHLHATAALAAGIPVHAVAERLAHTTPETVIKIYGHAIPAHDQRIADVMGVIFDSAAQ